MIIFAKPVANAGTQSQAPPSGQHGGRAPAPLSQSAGPLGKWTRLFALSPSQPRDVMLTLG